MAFLVKTSFFWQSFTNICKTSFFIFPNFFPAKVLSLKVFKKILGRRMQRRMQNPVEHLRWSILQILVNDFKLKTKLAKSSMMDI